MKRNTQAQYDENNRLIKPTRTVLETEMLEVLKRLETAARHRDNTMGDPCRLIECKAELESAAKAARATIAKAEGKVQQ